MISLREAQELHRLVGGPIETAKEGYAGKLDVSAVMVPLAELERARELVAMIIADLDNTSHTPRIEGAIIIEGRRSEFLVPLADADTRYSQWGADNTVLWPRVELLDALAEGAQEWALDNLCRECKERTLDDNEGYDGKCGDCADRSEGEDDESDD